MDLSSLFRCYYEGAAGVTSLIKTALALEKQMIPPKINFTSPNPHTLIKECIFNFLQTPSLGPVIAFSEQV